MDIIETDHIPIYGNNIGIIILILIISLYRIYKKKNTSCRDAQTFTYISIFLSF